MECKPGSLSAQRLFCATIIALSDPLSAAAAATDLLAYPAAKTQPLPPGIHSVVTRCGHTSTMEKSMAVDADPHAIAKWYQSRLPGSRTIDLSRAIADEADSSNQMTSIEVFAADGSQIVVVNRMNFDRGLVNASKAIGADKAQIGVEGTAPPFTPGYVAPLHGISRQPHCDSRPPNYARPRQSRLLSTTAVQTRVDRTALSNPSSVRDEHSCRCN